jgi:hypothetical protein
MSLTKTAYQIRRNIKLGGLSLLTLILLFSVLRLGFTIFKRSRVVKIEPNVKYGILPKIVFPEKEFTPKNFSFEMPNDSIPKFDDQAKVYIVFRTDKSFLALEQEIETARQMGFPQKGVDIGNNIYEFKNNNNQTLRINILDGSFKLSYPYGDDQILIANKSVPNKEAAQEQAKSFLGSVGRLPEDLASGNQNVTFLKLEGGNLRQVESISEANMARVDLYRKNFDNNIKIMSIDTNKAPVSLLLSGSGVGSRNIVDVDYKYVNIDRESYATYPTKKIEEAISELKEGKYWPVSDVSSDNVIIRNIYLAYFEPITLTNFMQPIYVFEGDNKFTAYVPAVSNKFTK